MLGRHASLIDDMLMSCCLLTLFAVQLNWRLWPHSEWWWLCCMPLVFTGSSTWSCLAAIAVQLSSGAVCLAAPQQLTKLRGDAQLWSAARLQNGSSRWLPAPSMPDLSAADWWCCASKQADLLKLMPCNLLPGGMLSVLCGKTGTGVSCC